MANNSTINEPDKAEDGEQEFYIDSGRLITLCEQHGIDFDLFLIKAALFIYSQEPDVEESG